jgi:hypothetical protein
MAEEKKEQETTALQVNSLSEEIGMLNEESKQIINQLITETDPAKTKDLTELFNINQTKKTMARIDKLNNVLDNLTDETARRLISKPDQISTKELLDAIKITQDVLERSQKQASGTSDTPLIQINTQTNIKEVKAETMTRESRVKVQNVVNELLRSIKAETDKADNDETILDAEIVEVKEDKTNDQ